MSNVSDPNTDIERLDLQSLNVAEQKRHELLRLFPEVRTEGGKIDFDRLKLTLGTAVDVGKERYGLTWPGKAECFRTIQTPSTATLRPMRDESVNFDTTENLIIEGDNLEVLKLLQKAYLGKVKMIYIDPPYNTGNDFIYPDNYTESLQTYLAYTGQVDAEGKKFSTNTEADGRFHSRWLNMMYPRLFFARNLLSQDGAIFISCDDHEAANVRRLSDEIFGEENFVAQFVWNTEGHTDNQFDVKITHEYVALYAKDSDAFSIGHVVDPNTREASNLWKGYAENSITKNGPGNPPSEVALPVGFPCASNSLSLAPSGTPKAFFEAVSDHGFISRELTDRYAVEYPVRLDAMSVQNHALVIPCRIYSGWANVNKLRAFIAAGCRPIDDGGDLLSFYLSDRGVVYYRRERTKARNVVSVLRNLGTTERMRSELEAQGIKFSYPKPKELLRYLVQLGSENGGIVLDFFAGSGTTAQAVLDASATDGKPRSFVLVQLPEPTGLSDQPTIAAITRERVRKLTQKSETSLPISAAGFRALSLAESNLSTWDGHTSAQTSDLEHQLSLHVHHLRPGRTDDDLLFEVLLKEGFPLTTPWETVEVATQKVESIADGALIICLSRTLDLDGIRAIADRGPQRVVCLDEGFAGNDQLKANAAQIFKSKGIVFRTV